MTHAEKDYAGMFARRFNNLESWVANAQGKLDDEGRGKFATRRLLQSILDGAKSHGHTDPNDTEMPFVLNAHSLNLTDDQLFKREEAIKKGLEALGINYIDFTTFSRQMDALEIYEFEQEIKRLGRNPDSEADGRIACLRGASEDMRIVLDRGLGVADRLQPGLRQQIETSKVSGKTRDISGETHEVSCDNFIQLIKSPEEPRQLMTAKQRAAYLANRTLKLEAFGA